MLEYVVNLYGWCLLCSEIKICMFNNLGFGIWDEIVYGWFWMIMDVITCGLMSWWWNFSCIWAFMQNLLNKETFIKIGFRSWTWGRVLDLGLIVQVYMDRKTCLE